MSASTSTSPLYASARRAGVARRAHRCERSAVDGYVVQRRRVAVPVERVRPVRDVALLVRRQLEDRCGDATALDLGSTARCAVDPVGLRGREPRAAGAVPVAVRERHAVVDGVVQLGRRWVGGLAAGGSRRLARAALHAVAEARHLRPGPDAVRQPDDAEDAAGEVRRQLHGRHVREVVDPLRVAERAQVRPQSFLSRARSTRWRAPGTATLRTPKVRPLAFRYRATPDRSAVLGANRAPNWPAVSQCR